jgi:hypothetical protein
LVANPRVIGSNTGNLVPLKQQLATIDSFATIGVAAECDGSDREVESREES